jgi:tRNA G18 (ribose-2'-O)-methylase SpoU
LYGAPNVIEITDLTDPALRDYTSLKDVKLRALREPREGLYIAESSQVIKRALQARHHPRSLLMARRWLGDFSNEFASGAIPASTPIFVADEPELTALTGFHLHRGALAAMHRPVALDVEDVIRNANRIAVVENVVDHTNLGAIFRSAAALGVDAVLVTPDSADPLYRRSVRVSMGAVFSVPWTRIDNWPKSMTLLKSTGFTVVAMALTDNAIALDDFSRSLPSKLAIIMGNEGYGLHRETLRAVDAVVKIPMQAGVDSLNVAAASAVAFWEMRSGGALIVHRE